MGRLMQAYFLLIFALFTTSAYGETSSSETTSGKRFLFGYGGNYPMSKSKERYKHSKFHPIIGVRHVSENWILGISMHFKILKTQANDSQLAIWTLQEEFNYKIRFYHPLYLLIGAKTLYLYPVQVAKYPFRRRDDVAGPEVGIAASAGLIYFFPKNIGLGVYADLWRGTGSRKYQAYEFGMNLTLPFSF